MLYWNLPPVVKNAQKLKIYFLSTIGTYISYILRFFIVGLGCSTPMPLYSILLDRTINQVVLQTNALEQRCVYLWLVMLESCSQMGKSQPLGRKENNPFLLLTTSKKRKKRDNSYSYNFFNVSTYIYPRCIDDISSSHFHDMQKQDFSS